MLDNVQKGCNTDVKMMALPFSDVHPKAHDEKGRRSRNSWNPASSVALKVKLTIL